jgi:8-oxo-dGTP pyrophosphatase MutT (NUDIX family)
VLIVPTQRAADGSVVVGLPKGHPDKGETAEQAARREIREEAGVNVTVGAALGDVHYWYQRGGKRISKTVRFFICDYIDGDVSIHDGEVERAWWAPLSQAAEELSYPGEREIAQKALQLLQPTQ